MNPVDKGPSPAHALQSAAISEQEIRYFASHKDSTLAKTRGLWTLTPIGAGSSSPFRSMVIGLLSFRSDRALMSTLRSEYQRLGQEEKLGTLPNLTARNPRDLAGEIVLNLDKQRKASRASHAPSGEKATGTLPASATHGGFPSQPTPAARKRAQDQTRWPTETRTVQVKASDGTIAQETIKVIKRNHRKPLPVPPAAHVGAHAAPRTGETSDPADFDDLIYAPGKGKTAEASDPAAPFTTAAPRVPGPEGRADEPDALVRLHAPLGQGKQ